MSTLYRLTVQGVECPILERPELRVVYPGLTDLAEWAVPANHLLVVRPDTGDIVLAYVCVSCDHAKVAIADPHRARHEREMRR